MIGFPRYRAVSTAAGLVFHSQSFPWSPLPCFWGLRHSVQLLLDTRQLAAKGLDLGCVPAEPHPKPPAISLCLEMVLP